MYCPHYSWDVSFLSTSFQLNRSSDALNRQNFPAILIRSNLSLLNGIKLYASLKSAFLRIAVKHAGSVFSFML